MTVTPRSIRPGAPPRDRTSPPTARHATAAPGIPAISRTMRAAEPVFIVGEARSGSTLLLHTLLKHPTFAPRRENLQESSFVVQAPAAATFEGSPPRNLRRFLLDDDDAWQDFLASIRHLRPWARAAAATPTVDLQWRLGPARLVARSFAYHAWRARGCERLLEKTPDHVLHVDRIYASFPRARLVYVHRHPVDVYSSYVRRGQVDPKAAWARIGPHEFCERHQHRTDEALRAAARRPDSFLLVRYERLTAEPEGELERICRFLDEPCDPAPLLAPDPDRHRVAHWEGTRHLYQGITTDTKRWQDYCTADDASQVEILLADLMQRLGYERYTR